MGSEFAAWAKEYGALVAVLIGILFTNQRGVWCWRSALVAEEKRHAETRADRDRWQATAFHALGIATSSTALLERRVAP